MANFIILSGNLVVVIWELFKPTPLVTNLNASVMFIEFMALLACFIVTGLIIFKKLVIFFEQKYEA